MKSVAGSVTTRPARKSSLLSNENTGSRPRDAGWASFPGAHAGSVSLGPGLASVPPLSPEPWGHLRTGERRGAPAASTPLSRRCGLFPSRDRLMVGWLNPAPCSRTLWCSESRGTF